MSSCQDQLDFRQSKETLTTWFVVRWVGCCGSWIRPTHTVFLRRESAYLLVHLTPSGGGSDNSGQVCHTMGRRMFQRLL